MGCIHGRVDTKSSGVGILGCLPWQWWDGAVPTVAVLWDLFEASTKSTLLPTGLDFCLIHCRVGDRNGKTCRKGRIMSP